MTFFAHSLIQEVGEALLYFGVGVFSTLVILKYKSGAQTHRVK